MGRDAQAGIARSWAAYRARPKTGVEVALAAETQSLMGEADDVAPVVCAFPRTDLPRNSRADYRFTAVPRSCWGHAGAAISSDWMRF